MCVTYNEEEFIQVSSCLRPPNLFLLYVSALLDIDHLLHIANVYKQLRWFGYKIRNISIQNVEYNLWIVVLACDNRIYSINVYTASYNSKILILIGILFQSMHTSVSTSSYRFILFIIERVFNVIFLRSQASDGPSSNQGTEVPFKRWSQQTINPSHNSSFATYEYTKRDPKITIL